MEKVSGVHRPGLSSPGVYSVRKGTDKRHGVPNWVTMSDAKQVSLGQRQKATGAHQIKDRDGKGCPKTRRLWEEVPEGGDRGQTFQVKGSRYLKALPDCSRYSSQGCSRETSYRF